MKTIKILSSNGATIETIESANPYTAIRRAIFGLSRIAVCGGWIYRFDARQNKIRRVQA